MYTIYTCMRALKPNSGSDSSLPNFQRYGQYNIIYDQYYIRKLKVYTILQRNKTINTYALVSQVGQYQQMFSQLIR